MASEGTKLRKFNKIIQQSTKIEEGTPIRYHLKQTADSHDECETYRKITYGEKDTNKTHKTILMVGETGMGKTKLINAIVNYMLGVQREDKVWFEITDDQSDRTSVHSQTSIITVYGFYPQESPIHLTIIDTPGYGDTHDIKNDKEIALMLLELSRCDDCFHDIDAVCLVIMAQQNRLSNRQIYVFDAVQSLFGNDIAENIVLFLTHSNGAHPKNALMAVKEAEIKCAVNDKNQPVYFLFDNCQGETFDENGQKVQEQSWNLSIKGMTGFFTFLDNIKPKTVKMTQNVLQQRKHLEENISNIRSHIQKIDKKQNELKDALEKKKNIKVNKDFEYEVEVTYRERVAIDPAVSSVAMCCTVCEENCHYPDCWWISGLSWCRMIKNNHCTVCTNKCHYTKHVKEAKIYETRTKKEKRTNEELKKKYDDTVRETENVVKKMEEELQELEKDKIKSVMKAIHCVDSLEMIALNTDSLNTLLHIDYLIEKLKEINEHKKAETLENIKKRAGEKNRAIEYMSAINVRSKENEKGSL